ncbi:hypothetical protein [Schlesneria sp. DSM 10557]|uniref:hypothetical protein n=1 Tax=Schlesneria sp. DSM 10557 TaxID=3044399 RepID=UPI0035A03527
MKNYVHVIVKPLPDHTLAELTHSSKSLASDQANLRLTVPLTCSVPLHLVVERQQCQKLDGWRFSTVSSAV